MKKLQYFACSYKERFTRRNPKSCKNCAYFHVYNQNDVLAGAINLLKENGYEEREFSKCRCFVPKVLD